MHIYLIKTFLFVLMFVAFHGVINAGETPTPVEAKLVSNVTAVEPGSAFELGVVFDVEPGWHIYWKNPGDSGLPTSVKLTVPEGYKTDEIVWPIPHVFNAAGGIVDYGYEDSLLLASEITAPEDLPTGTKAEFKANASWVSCKEVCIPGRSELTLTLPVSEEAEDDNKELFAKWEDREPVDLSSDGSQYGIEVEVKEAGDGISNVAILLNAGDDAKKIEMYPGPSKYLIVENISVGPHAENGETLITFDVKKLKGGDTPLPPLETLIVFTDGGGRSGLSVPVSLDKAE
jgi:DsbC/DsbD-like thiol-disulfide interchange protein